MKRYEYTIHTLQAKNGGIIRVISFYPAEKGRYERKILPGR